MSHRSTATRNARRLERLYQTKAHGVKHMTVLRLLSERGLDGAIEQLEAWGMKAEVVVNDASSPEPVRPLADETPERKRT